MREIPAGSYSKDVLTGEGWEGSPLGVNQGILISSDGMLIKVEELPCAALLWGQDLSGL